MNLTVITIHKYNMKNNQFVVKILYTYINTYMYLILCKLLIIINIKICLLLLIKF